MSSHESSRDLSPMEWSCLLAFCAASPFVSVLVQGYMARLIVPTLSAVGASSATGLLAGIFVLNVLGTLVAAAILCVPLGWLAPRRPALFGAIVGLVGGVVVLWLGSSTPPDGVALWALRIMELVAFVGGCILFAIVGAMHTRRVAA
jgi:hypothetical protein